LICLKDAEADHVAVILKGREPARILVAIGGKDNDSPHLELKQRWVNQYNFYLNDKHWGPMFVRMCPYFPFSARVCLHPHHWLAIRRRQEEIDFEQCQNTFLRCWNPERPQELADSLNTADLLQCGHKRAVTYYYVITSRKPEPAYGMLGASNTPFMNSRVSRGHSSRKLGSSANSRTCPRPSFSAIR